MTILILCSTMPEAQAFYRDALERGETLVASSSMIGDEADRDYTAWEWLPDVYHKEFDELLKNVMSKHKVTQIFCPHNVVYKHIQKMNDAGTIKAPLIGKTTAERRITVASRYFNMAKEAQETIRQISEQEPPADFRIAGILRQAELTNGESSVSKQVAAMGIFPLLPEGDIIEVGCLWGKMASVLIMLARNYNKGAVLCVDPLSHGTSSLVESPELQKIIDEANFDMIFNGLLMHTSAVATPGKFNYVRDTSEAGEKLYRANATITTPEFGAVKYAQKIALIHIDGNHDYAFAKLDYEKWRPHMAPGGWIILDDYVWAHGDGPRKVGDEALADEGAKITRAFVAGKALFMQFA